MKSTMFKKLYEFLRVGAVPLLVPAWLRGLQPVASRLGAVLLVVLAAPSLVSAVTSETGKSFFAPQPMSAMLAPQTAMFEEFARRTAADNERFYFSVTPFFSRSNAGKNLRRYFFPEGKDELVIKGSEAGGDADVSGTWLQIMGENPTVPSDALLYNAFQSKISINPVYENLGVNLNFYKNVSEKVFIAAEMAVMQNKVMHGFSEYDVQNQSTRAAIGAANFVGADGHPSRVEPVSRIYSLNATEAFTNPFWAYGKLASNPIKKEGISDLVVKAGVHFGSTTLFAKMILPTSQKPTAAYMFEPLTGNGSHFGLGLGGSLELEKELSKVMLRFSTGGEYVYVFENTQQRTFDLTNGTWSRYLLMRDIGQVNSEPGVNYLTLSTKVVPGHSVNWQLQGSVLFKKLSLNLGYKFYFTQDESIILAGNNFQQQFNIATGQLLDDNGGGVGLGLCDYFSPGAIIGVAEGDEAGLAGPPGVVGIAPNITTPINLQNVQIQSAQQPAKLMSQLGAVVGIEELYGGYSVSFKLGYSYNIDHNRTALEGWTMWAQLGFKV